MSQTTKEGSLTISEGKVVYKRIIEAVRLGILNCGNFSLISSKYKSWQTYFLFLAVETIWAAIFFVLYTVKGDSESKIEKLYYI